MSVSHEVYNEVTRAEGEEELDLHDPTAANVGYEAGLWQIVDALCGSMDAAESEYVVLVVLGRIFRKYLSDTEVDTCPMRH